MHAKPEPPDSPWWWTGCVVALIFAALLFAFTDTPADADLWGHITFGRDTLHAGHVARTDSYSFLTEGNTWINHEWLAEVAMAAAWDAGGTPALVLLKGSLALLLATLLYAHLRRRGHRPLAAALVLGVVMTLVLPGLRPVRPQMFTYVSFLLLGLALEASTRRGPSVLWALVPLMACWANLHGGFLAGVAVIGIWGGTRVAGVLVSRRSQPGDACWEAVAWALPLALAVAATLATPYGPELWAFLRTAFSPRHEIAEWNPIEIPTVSGLGYLVLIVLTWTAVTRAGRRTSPEALLTLGFTSLAPLFAVRHAPLFALSCGVFGADALAQLGRSEGDAQRPSPAPARDPRRWVAAMFLASAVALIAGSSRHLSCIAVDSRFPVAAVSKLENSGASGNLVVFFDWGEYAIWHLAPRLKVSMDGRRETVYSEDVYWEDHRFTFGNDPWDDVLRTRPADLALVPRTLAVYNLMKLESGWHLVFQDRRSALFTREDYAGRDAVERAPVTPPPVPGCFPS